MRTGQGSPFPSQRGSRPGALQLRAQGWRHSQLEKPRPSHDNATRQTAAAADRADHGTERAGGCFGSGAGGMIVLCDRSRPSSWPARATPWLGYLAPATGESQTLDIVTDKAIATEKPRLPRPRPCHDRCRAKPPAAVSGRLAAGWRAGVAPWAEQYPADKRSAQATARSTSAPGPMRPASCLRQIPSICSAQSLMRAMCCIIGLEITDENHE